MPWTMLYISIIRSSESQKSRKEKYSFLTLHSFTLYALLFVRGERAVQDDKYDILKHPNIALTVDGGAARYIHGIAPHAFDLEEIILDANFDDYEILSEVEVNQFYENKEENKNEGN